METYCEHIWCQNNGIVEGVYHYGRPKFASLSVATKIFCCISECVRNGDGSCMVCAGFP